MPRPKMNEAYLQKKKVSLEEEIARLQEQKRATERAIDADERKKQLAWEARVGRLAWNAGLHAFALEALEVCFQEIAQPEHSSVEVVSTAKNNGVPVEVL